MFSTLRNRFGIPGVISVMALVFAMIGGAYAASNGGSDNGATASAKKSAKGPRGPRGPKGATGAAGPAGPAGPAGAKGDAGAAGANGEKGATGASGTNGQGVTTAVEPPLGECGGQEGVEITSASGTEYVCNGADGSQGPPGDPWTAGGTLPSGATETGALAGTIPLEKVEVNFSTEEVTNTAVMSAVAPISFPIPLASPLDAADTKVIAFGADPGDECDNGVGTPPGPENPEADSGFLCVFTSLSGSTEILPFVLKGGGGSFAGGASVSGAVVLLKGGAGHQVKGTWAVTG